MVTSVVFTYTVSRGDVPVATLTESTEFTYVASAGAVGTSLTTVATVTALSTETVLGSSGNASTPSQPETLCLELHF